MIEIVIESGRLHNMKWGTQCTHVFWLFYFGLNNIYFVSSTWVYIQCHVRQDLTLSIKLLSKSFPVNQNEAHCLYNGRYSKNIIIMVCQK